MSSHAEVTFDQPGIAGILATLNDTSLNTLPFGVIGFDQDGLVQSYNNYGSHAAGLSTDRVIGQDLFTLVAPCMNNFLVAQRFADAQEDGSILDDIIP